MLSQLLCLSSLLLFGKHLVRKRVIHYFSGDLCVCVSVAILPGIFQDWVETGGNSPSSSNQMSCSHTHTHTDTNKADLSEQAAVTVSDRGDWIESLLIIPSTNICTLCSYSYKQQLCQKGNQSINNSQCRTAQTLKWLIVSLMVQQLFMVITTDFQEIMHDGFFPLLVCFFSSHKNWDNSVFAFVVWKIYLMACLLSLHSCNLVCWELFSLLHVFCLEAAAGNRGERFLLAFPASGVFLYHRVHP